MSNMYDPVTESIVLAGIVKNPSKLMELDGKYLVADDFYFSEHQCVYEILRNIVINQNPTKIDEFMFLTTAKELGIKITDRENKVLEVITSRNVSPETLIQSAKIVKKSSIKRYLQAVFEEQANFIEKAEGTISDIIGNAENTLYKALNGLGQPDSEIIDLSEGFEKYIRSLVGAKPIGLSLGFDSWENDIGKIRNGNVHGIFGRMKQGKSQLALQLAVRAAVLKKIPTLILDSELGKELQWIRIAGQLAKIPYKFIEDGTWAKNKDMTEKMNEAFIKMKDAPFSYVKIAGWGINEVASQMRRFALKYNDLYSSGTPKVLVIYDYVKLPDISSLADAREYQILGAISSRLHDEASRLNLPVVMVGQLNRSAAEIDAVENIADSDKIARDIESVSVIRWKTERELGLDSSENGTHVLKVLVARNGPGHVGEEYINLHFDKSSGFITEGQRFSNDKLEFLRSKTKEVV